MKSLLSPNKLKLLIPGCGIAGAVLRLIVNAAGIDDRGLIIPGHPALILLYVLTAAAATLILTGTRSIQGPDDHRSSFPASLPAALGCALIAGSTISVVCSHFRTGPVHTGAPALLPVAGFYLTGILTAAAALAFLILGLCRLQGRKPFFLFHAVVCAGLALRTMALYQTRSFDPQIPAYCFPVFACICLSIAAYQQATFDMDCGSHRKLWFWELAAVYLCCLAAADDLFFLSGAVWAWTSLSSLRIRRERKRLEPETIDETEV